MIENPYASPAADAAVISQHNDFADIPFKQLKKLRNDSNSIRALVVLLLLAGCLGMLGGLGLLVAPHESRSAAGVLGSSMFTVVTAIGLIKRTRWGRVLAIIYSVLMLVLFPIGTIVGALALGALGSKQLFGPARFDHRLLEAEFRYRKKHKID